MNTKMAQVRFRRHEQREVLLPSVPIQEALERWARADLAPRLGPNGPIDTREILVNGCRVDVRTLASEVGLVPLWGRWSAAGQYTIVGWTQRVEADESEVTS